MEILYALTLEAASAASIVCYKPRLLSPLGLGSFGHVSPGYISKLHDACQDLLQALASAPSPGLEG